MKSLCNSPRPVRFEINQVQPRMIRINANQKASKKSSSCFSILLVSNDSPLRFQNNFSENNSTRTEMFSKILLTGDRRAVCGSMAYSDKTLLKPKSPRLWIVEGSYVGQASRLISSDFRPQARRLTCIPLA